MKKLLFVLLALIVLGSCEKLADNIQEDLVIKAMTDGQWRVSNFKRDGNDVTVAFAPYAFKFKKDNTVDAINSGSVESSGTWDGNGESRTMAASFSNGNSTLMLLNGTWQITKNGWTYVEASQTVNNELRTLRLDK